MDSNAFPRFDGRLARGLFVTDLDGTLLDADRNVAKSNREAIAEATARGVHVAIVTGRRRSTVFREYPKLAGLEYRVASSNGAIVLGADNRTPERVFPLPWSVVDAVARKIHDPEVAAARILCIVVPGPEPDPRDCFVLTPGTGEWSHSDTPFRAETLIEVDPERARSGHLVHVAVQLETRERAECLRSLTRLPKGVSSHVVSSPLGVGALTEFVPRGGKGLALGYLAAAFGVPRKHTAAIGDELNDLDLLAAAAHRFAVGGSVLARTHPDAVVVASAGDGAVADAIARFLDLLS